MRLLLIVLSLQAAGWVREPKLGPEPPVAGRELARASLPPLLDAQRDVLRQTIAGKEWALGVAADPSLLHFYVTFEREGELLLVPLDKPKTLLKPGLKVEVQPHEFCNMKVDFGLLDLFNPLKCATMVITGTGEKPRELALGELLDAIQRKALELKVGKAKYWVLYMSDVDPGTDQLAGTRTIVIVREAGLKTRAWPVPEASLPALVDLGEARIAVSLADARIVVTDPQAR